MATAVARDDPGLRAPTLPRPLTPILGRGSEIEQVVSLLLEDATRLLTLLGPGGVGKTRLAIAVAEEVLRRGEVDIVFVDLAPVRDPNRVLDEIGRALDLDEEPSEENVAAAVRARAPLLILDNLEQLAAAAPAIGRLLGACPACTVLATSRVPLRLRGERTVVVPPLPVPAPADASSNDRAARNPAIALFVDRARAVRQDFALTDANRGHLVEICRRIDGIPLAIELAAARSRLLSPAALLARLEDRLTVLSGGAVDQPVRHQTLHDTIAWSVDILDDTEQALLSSLAVFAGGFSVEAVEAVCLPATESAAARRRHSALDRLTSLAEQSLVQTETGPGGEVRLRLLETVREFAWDELATIGDRDATRDRHAAFFANLAATAEPELMGSDQATWFRRLDVEHENLRAALAWLIERGRGTEAVRFAADLWPFWYGKGHLAEGRRWLEGAIALAADADPDERARAHNGLGAICFAQADMDGATAACTAAAELWRESGDRRQTAIVLNNLAILAEKAGDYAEATRLHEEALAIFRELDDRYREAAVISNIAAVARTIGEHDRARALDERALGIRRAINDQVGVASSLHNLGLVLLDADDLDAAAGYMDEAARLFEDLGDPRMVARALGGLGQIAAERGDLASSDAYHLRALGIWKETGDERGLAATLNDLGATARRRGDRAGAMSYLRECLESRRRAHDPITAAPALESVAQVARDAGHFAVAVTLFAAARRIREETGYAVGDPRSGADALRPLLGDKAFSVAEENGRRSSFEEAVDLALAFDPNRAPTPAPAPPPPKTPAPEHDLTPRELEVLRLVTAGKTNTEIGEVLFISPFTAKTHVGNLLGKLGLESRSAAAAWAARHGIA